jgi:integrase
VDWRRFIDDRRIRSRRAEVERLIGHVRNQKHRTMILTTYAAGLRLNEVLHLRVGDIDSARMTIRVEQGKGGQDRYTVLSRTRSLVWLNVSGFVSSHSRGNQMRHCSSCPSEPARSNTTCSGRRHA